MSSPGHLDRALEGVKAIREREGHRSADAAAERAVGVIKRPPLYARPPFTAPPRWLEPEPEREWWTGEIISPEPEDEAPHLAAAARRALTARRITAPYSDRSVF